MDEQPLDTSPEENKSPAQSNIEVGDIHIGGSVGGNFIVGQNITINPEQQVFRSLHQLPQPPADFTGREELIAQLLADFKKGKGATITGQPIHGLVGMGGIGKTALGLVVAHQLKKDYPDAQIFLDLKGTTTPLSAIDIMRHVILSFEPAADLRSLDEAGMTGVYQSILDGKRALLFLDNARSAEQVAPLKPPDTSALLLTSRWTFGVPGLKNRHVNVMSRENAERFLLELCPHTGEKVTELAEACACLPLALRIAGSFLGVNEHWNVEKYIAQLNDRKQRLATLKRSRASAELTTEPDLLAVFEFSYNQLSEENRKRWRMLGVFPTSFNISAVGAMWELDPEGDETTTILGSLLRYSLLDHNETSTRYSLHDLLADFALTKMQEEEEASARIAHAVYYSKVLENINQMYLQGGAHILPALRLYDAEQINIDVGEQTSVRYLKESQDAARACNWYAGQGSINALRLKPEDRIKWLEAGLQAARILKAGEDEATHLGNLGSAYWALGNAHKAIEFHERRLAIARGTRDRYGEGNALNHLGLAFADLGEPHKAIAFHEQALAINREMSDRRSEEQSLSNLGSVYAEIGNARKAIEYFELALTIAREIGDRRGEGNVLSNLGSVHGFLGDAHKAIEYFEPALAIAHEIGDRHGEESAVANLGIAYKKLGQARRAIEYYEQALAIAREMGDRNGEATDLFNMGLALYGLEEKDRAINLMKHALEIFEAIESPTSENARNALKEWGAL